MDNSLSQELFEVVELQRQQRKLQHSLESARQSLAQEETRLAELDRRLTKEGRDVEKLEGLSLTGLFYTVLGSKEEQLDKERQELLAARLRYEQSRHAFETLTREIEDLKRQLSSLGNVDARYQALFERKQAQLLQAGDDRTRQILDLVDQLAAARAESKELEEAIQAGREARQGLEAVLSSAGSARDWGVWDLLGGGFLTTMVKHNRMDEARQAAHIVQQDLRRFQRELADLNQTSGELVVEFSSFETFADYFFDGLLIDWMVQSKIEASLEAAREMDRQVKRILSGLEQRLDANQEKIALLQEDRRRLVEDAA